MAKEKFNPFPVLKKVQLAPSINLILHKHTL